MDDSLIKEYIILYLMDDPSTNEDFDNAINALDELGVDVAELSDKINQFVGDLVREYY